MALRDENTEDEKEEKPKVYKSDIASEESGSTNQNSHRPIIPGDDVKPEKNDVGLEADVQPCPSISGTSANDTSAKQPSSTEPEIAVVSNGENGIRNNVSDTTTTTSIDTDPQHSTAFTRTNPKTVNGSDSLMHGFTPNSGCYPIGMPTGFAFLPSAGPNSAGLTSHGIFHPVPSYPPNFPAFCQVAAATAHFVSNRFPGNPNGVSPSFNFHQGAPQFTGISPSCPTASTVDCQTATAQAAFPFPLCTDPKPGIRSPFGFFSTGQCSPSFGSQLTLIQPSALEQWYAAAQRYTSPVFPFMLASRPLACSPSGTLSPIVNNSPIAGGTLHTLPSNALAPPLLMPAYATAASGLQYSTGTNDALTAMSQIPIPANTTPVKSVVTNCGTSASASTPNGHGSIGNADTVSRTRTSADNESKMDENSVKKGNRDKEKTSKKLDDHIKKPLNAFMLYMREMRIMVMREGGLKEKQSAEINKILGKRWQLLSTEQQQKYFDLARQEQVIHRQRYPNWSARDNYAIHKKKKKKKDKAAENLEMKKCRARFGLDQQSKWCKHCRRKKKCLWFREDSASTTGAGTETSGNGDSPELSPPCTQVTSTTNGPDASAGSTWVVTTETDVNSPQSMITTTVPVCKSNEENNHQSIGSTRSPGLLKKTDSVDDGDYSENDEEDEMEMDEEAEAAAAAAKAAVDGADFDDELESSPVDGKLRVVMDEEAPEVST